MEIEEIEKFLLECLETRPPTTEEANESLNHLHKLVQKRYKSFLKVISIFGPEPAPSIIPPNIDLPDYAKVLPKTKGTKAYQALEKQGLASFLKHKVVKGEDAWEINGNFQLYSCEWEALRHYMEKDDAPPPRLLKYKKFDKEKGINQKITDSAGRLFPRKMVGKEGHKVRDGVFPHDKEVYTAAADYLCELFDPKGGILEHHAHFFDALTKSYGKTHRVTISLDYYYSRDESRQGRLHKDTTGTTLFAGLHYDNDKEILGPEYMYDFWPIPPKVRHRAPWIHVKKGSGEQFWPADLLKALSEARHRLEVKHKKDKRMTNYTIMKKNGLIAFVDELIFHASPLPRRRDKGKDKKSSEDYKKFFTTLGVSTTPSDFNTMEQLFQLHEKDGDKAKLGSLERRLSIDIEHKVEELKPLFGSSEEEKKVLKSTAEHGRRSFVRFWVMVEPNIWFDDSHHH